MDDSADGAEQWGMYHESIVVDCLNVMRLEPRNIAAAKRAGITAMNYTAVRPSSGLVDAIKEIASVREIIDATDVLSLILTPDDITRAKVEGRLGIILGMQNAKPIGDDVAYLRTFHDLGVRIIQLTHNTQSYIGTGCIEPDNGLTRFGRRVVDEMNRLGLVIDVAHCGPKTTLDAIECSQVPVLCSHANPRGVCDSPRNKSDDIFERLAANGGVAGVSAWSPICFRDKERRPTIDDVVACFEHLLRIVGPEHVAIGSDLCDGLYDSVSMWNMNHGPNGVYPEVTGILGDWYGLRTWYAKGVESVDKLPELARALKAKVHDEKILRQVLGLSYLKVFEAVTR